MTTTSEETPRVQVSEFTHFVQFCETDAFLVNALSAYIGAGLRAGDVCIVVATQPHRESLDKQLELDGLPFSAARARDQYLSFDAATTLSKFMVDDSPDVGRFVEVIGSIIRMAAQNQRRVRVFGEMVALLWADGNRRAAIRLEELWNDLGQNHAFSLFCAYPMQGFDGEVYEAEFAEICKQHAHVFPTESYAALATPDERLRAITLLQQKANSLEVEIARRKELEKRKDEFISVASHELKTPVTSLKGFLHLLQRRLAAQGNDTELYYLARMGSQVDRLTKLINDLLDISKMQTGQLSYREEWFAMDALVQEIVENVQGTTQTHCLLLEGRVQTEVFGDRDRIGQVLINLLNNAIKYSPSADKVLVHVAKDQDRILVDVQDFGIGIAREHQQRVFERFYQVTDSDERPCPGLGIGLYISCEIVRRHGGELWVESEKGEGSTFHFTLPLIQRGKS